MQCSNIKRGLNWGISPAMYHWHIAHIHTYVGTSSLCIWINHKFLASGIKWKWKISISVSHNWQNYLWVCLLFLVLGHANATEFPSRFHVPTNFVYDKNFDIYTRCQLCIHILFPWLRNKYSLKLWPILTEKSNL